MFGNVTALEGLHVAGKYRDKSMQHTCYRHPHTFPGVAGDAVVRASSFHPIRDHNLTCAYLIT